MSRTGLPRHTHPQRYPCRDPSTLPGPLPRVPRAVTVGPGARRGGRRGGAGRLRRSLPHSRPTGQLGAPSRAGMEPPTAADSQGAAASDPPPERLDAPGRRGGLRGALSPDVRQEAAALVALAGPVVSAPAPQDPSPCAPLPPRHRVLIAGVGGVRGVTPLPSLFPRSSLLS